ncbi:MAG: hypothetical protein HYY48_04215 [Gammaproteobacteria bacterium]|nr:hypothetical protein [Gammaproteobacteria bacterium]
MAIRLGAKSKFQQPFDPITAVLFKMIQALTFFFVLAVMFMNPMAKKGIIDPKAEYLITVTWPDNNPDDIDAWVEDPDGNLVWFRSRDAGLVHLDRDDRGLINDTLDINGRVVQNPLNQEVVTIRSIIPGEYIVNVHYYASATHQPVPVTVRVDKVNPSLEVIYYDTLTLASKGEERTALRFSIDPDGRVYDINQMPKSLVMIGKGA